MARQRNAAESDRLDYNEKLSLVCNYFCEGHMPAQICELMEEKHGVTMTRELPYKYLAKAARDGLIRFVAPPEYTLRDHVKHQYSWLDDVQVAHTATFSDVATHAAGKLIDLMRQRRRPPYGQNEVHVGFAGGGAMCLVAKRLAERLREPDSTLPKRIVFHAMVAGFNVEDPTTAPNAFFTYFNDPSMQVETKFVGLHAPPIVKEGQYDQVCDLDIVSESFKRAGEIDIVVTSGTGWSERCHHSMLREYMKESGTHRALEEAGCVGDMLWRPFSAVGPLEQDTARRALTLVELSDLTEWIDDGKWVMLVVGPCRKCQATRGVLLETILNLPRHLVSHLVVDSCSVAEMLRARDGAAVA